jgi:nitrilase
MTKGLWVTAVQTHPQYLDRTATAERIAQSVSDLGASGSRLIVFPEAMLSMYPLTPEDRYLQDGKTRGEDYWELFVSSSVTLDGAELALICRAAKSAHTHVVVGINERAEVRRGVVYNTAVLIDPEGHVVGVHRKILAVAHESSYYTKGAGDDIKVWPTSIGKIGLAICFENLSPQYRHALAVQGEEIHCALWTGTAINPERSSGPIIVSATTQAALEARCYVVAACQVSSSDDPPGPAGYRPLVPFVGGSGIAAPNGTFLAGPAFSGEEIVAAEIDLASLPRALALFDPFGRDARDDLFAVNPASYRNRPSPTARVS